jgi:glycosyltransferase involved in cell wall biosynthesis
MNQPNRKSPATISIGMPVYNGEKYIREALDTLLGQSFTDFELIISDNASSDSTESICREYAENDTRISYVRQQSNIGAAANFLYVINQAVGIYFMWAACDDRWSSDWLEKMHEAIKEPGVGMAFGQIVHIDASGHTILHPANGVNFSYGYSGIPLLRRTRFYLAYEGMGKANSIYSLYKRELVGPLCSMWAEIIDGGLYYDYTIVYGCLQYQRIKQVDRATLFKRIHGESEGSSPKKRSMSVRYLAKIIAGLLWPFPPKLLRDYLQHSTITERFILILFVPMKLLAAYGFRMKQIFMRAKQHLS